MTQNVFAVIYCALLASRSTGICTSPWSAAKVITDGIHDIRQSKRSLHQNVDNVHASLRCHRETGPTKSALSKFKHARGEIKNCNAFVVAARSKSSRDSCPRTLPQPAILRLSNPLSLPINYSGYVRANHSIAVRSAPNHHHEVLRPFRESMARLSSSTGDINETWDALESLRLSDTLSFLPDDELLEFMPHAYNACLLSVEPLVLRPKELVARLGRLHDEILQRSKGSAGPNQLQLLAWVKPCAIQTLILAGKVNMATQEVVGAFRSPARRDEIVDPRISLSQLFIASILHDNLETGLLVLAQFWPWIGNGFNLFQPDQTTVQTTVELRRSVLFAFNAIQDSKDFLQTIKDNTAQTIGTSILAYRLCASGSTDIIHAVHRDFVANGLPMSLETQLQFFKSLLAGGAYARAFDVRKHIHTVFHDALSRHQVEAALELFPEVASSDALHRKMQTRTLERVASFVKDPLMVCSDVFSIWDEVEVSGCLRLRDRDLSKMITDYQIRVFATVAINNSCPKLGDSEIPKSKAYADLLDRLCEVLKERYQRFLNDAERKAAQSKLLPMICHSLILKGDLPPVRSMLVKERKGHLPDRARTITQLFLAYMRNQGLSEAFESICTLWPRIVRHTDDANGRWVTKEMAAQSQYLRETLFQAFEGIEDPVAWIGDKLVSTEAQEAAGHLFCHLFRERRAIDKAIHLFDGLRARKLPLSYHAHIVLMKLFLPDLQYVAARVYQSLRDSFPEKTKVPALRGEEELHLGLWLFSCTGNTDQAEEYFRLLWTRRLVNGGARQRLMQAYAFNGNTEQVHRLFSEFYAGKANKTPTLEDFRVVIQAHVRAGDMPGINYWIDEMSKKKFRPDLGVYNMILTAMATSLELESATAVLQKMRENQVQPDCQSYTTVMSIMAVNRDPVGAERLYQTAVEEGVVPDDIMIFTLMNAHVEAGSWRGVIRAFDYLQHIPRPAHLTAELYDILLKAYVLIGAPFRTVYDLFQRYTALNLHPTPYTYSLLIQSACDAGRMDLAMSLFTRLDAMDRENDAAARPSYISIYVMTIIMAGFLRVGAQDRARAVYDDMRARGVQPTAVTFSIIISAYANERSEHSMRLADEFMQSLFAAEGGEGVQRAWLGSARGGRASALDAVYGPLLASYGAQRDIDQMEQHFDQMLAAGGAPGLVNMTTMMDAYRRVGDLAAVKHFWGEILKMTPRASNMLCVPMSVYMQALSAAGEHDTIAWTWRELRARGFAFDAHNWNHLAVALVRAGQPQRAFEVVENVILRQQGVARTFVRTRNAAKSPLTFVGPEGENTRNDDAAAAADDDDGEQGPPRDPRTPSRRTDSARDAAQHEPVLTPLDDSNDPAQQLYELQQLAHTWSGEALHAHSATLDVLGSAIRRLERGLLVRPTGAPGDDVSRPDPGERRAEEAEAAAGVLEDILKRFPGTVQLVEKRMGELARVPQEEETTSYS